MIRTRVDENLTTLVNAIGKHLGVKRPILAEYAIVDGRSGASGGYGGPTGPRGEHIIRINEPDPGLAVRAAAHECVHALQVERDHHGDWVQAQFWYQQFERLVGYFHNPVEVEARMKGDGFLRQFIKEVDTEWTEQFAVPASSW